jgi:hypothetical protein
VPPTLRESGGLEVRFVGLWICGLRNFGKLWRNVDAKSSKINAYILQTNRIKSHIKSEKSVEHLPQFGPKSMKCVLGPFWGRCSTDFSDFI